MQKSFLDAFLLGNDSAGWTQPGKVPKIGMVIRKGDGGVDDPSKEKSFPYRTEVDWPIPDTKYAKFFLNSDETLSEKPSTGENVFSYDALKG